VSDPLPASPALPLYQGESGFTVPLIKGDSRSEERARANRERVSAKPQATGDASIEDRQGVPHKNFWCKAG